MKIRIDDVCHIIEDLSEDGDEIVFRHRFTYGFDREVVEQILTKTQYANYVGNERSRTFNLSKKKTEILSKLIEQYGTH